MKLFVCLFVFVVTVAIINATCLYCGNNKSDRQEIKYEDLKSLEDFNLEYQNTNEPKNVANKMITIQKFVQKYPLYAKEAKNTEQFSDSLNLVDTTEFLANGDVQYKNATIHGLENFILKVVNFDKIDKNLFLVNALLREAEITGDYTAVKSKKKESGQFYITLKDVEFKTKLFLDQFLDVQPEIDAKSITFRRHESMYTNDDVLNELENQYDVPKPYAYYYNYLNEVIKHRIANEMAVNFKPLIAKRLEQLLNSAVLFQSNDLEVPKAIVNVAPGVQAKIFNTELQHLTNTNKIQKITNYTINDQGVTEMLFSFTSFDLRGNTDWALKYTSTGNVYNGKAIFAVDSVQTVIVATKSNQQGKINVKFANTFVNGLKMMLNNDDNCESIRDFAHERVPKVLEYGLKTFINELSEEVLKNQFALISDENQY